jgi:hypothetical protein
MDQPGLYTVGRTRTDCIENIHAFLQSNDPSSHTHLKIENERYYDTLEKNSDAQNQLKQKWDTLARWKQKQLNEWKKAYDNADSMDRHDLMEQKKQLLFLYEKERSVAVENNYHYFKTYMEGSNVEYPLE